MKNTSNYSNPNQRTLNQIKESFKPLNIQDKDKENISSLLINEKEMNKNNNNSNNGQGPLFDSSNYLIVY